MRLLAILVFACFGLAACGTTPGSQEGGVVDMGVAASSDGGAVDMAVRPRPDGAASVTCGQGFTCNNNCGGDQACGQACFDMINTPNGQTLFKSVQKCFSVAAVGACASKCGMPTQDC